MSQKGNTDFSASPGMSPHGCALTISCAACKHWEHKVLSYLGRSAAHAPCCSSIRPRVLIFPSVLSCLPAFLALAQVYALTLVVSYTPTTSVQGCAPRRSPKPPRVSPMTIEEIVASKLQTCSGDKDIPRMFSRNI